MPGREAVSSPVKDGLCVDVAEPITEVQEAFNDFSFNSRGAPIYCWR